MRPFELLVDTDGWSLLQRRDEVLERGFRVLGLGDAAGEEHAFRAEIDWYEADGVLEVGRVGSKRDSGQ